MLNARFARTTTSADWAPAPFRLRDRTSGDFLDLTGCKIDIAVQGPYPESCGDYLMDYGVPRCAPIIRLSTDDGTIQIIGLGVFQWSVPATQMHGICHGLYRVGCTIARDSVQRPLFLGNLPVVNGIV